MCAPRSPSAPEPASPRPAARCRRGGIGEPVLQVARAEVVDLAELARLEHLAREPHRRDEAVVERAHVHDAGRVHALPGLVGLVGVAAERLLAHDVLARLRRRDRGLGVQPVRRQVVEDADTRVGDDVAPVGHGAREAVALGRLAHGGLVAPADRDELGDQRRRPGHVRQGAQRVGVRLAHEGVAEHPDADAAGHRAFWNAASKASEDGAKSVRRRNAAASAAPHSRSIPESSHSTASGPW